MAATGRVNPEILQPHRPDQETLIGFEFSGKDLRWCYLFIAKNKVTHIIYSGRRIAGMTSIQGISSYFTSDPSSIWKIPESWTLEDAATVSVVYCTVIYALFMVRILTKSISLLISF